MQLNDAQKILTIKNIGIRLMFAMLNKLNNPLNLQQSRSVIKYGHLSNLRLQIALIPVIILSSFTMPAAAFELYNNKKGKFLNFNTEIALGYFSSEQDYSGQGRDDVKWTEGYLKFGLDGEAPLSNSIVGYSAISGLYTFTEGDGDAGGLTVGDESEFDPEDVYAGLRFKDVFGSKSNLDFSVGAQQFIIGDGFLVYGAGPNSGNGLGPEFDQGGAYWLGSRKAFDETIVLKADLGTGIRADLFQIKSDVTLQGNTELAGINLEYTHDTAGTVGLSYLEVQDVDTSILGGAFGTRDGLETVNLRYQGSAGVENLFLSAEVAYQDGSASESSPDVDAYAYYGEIGYTFVNLPWSPAFGYRYSHYSGDKAGTSTYEGFDPLFYGFSRGYGTWFQGEVAGNYSGPLNTNTTTQMVRLDLKPVEYITVGMRYFDFEPDQPEGQDGQEFNLFAEIPLRENLIISPLYGYHKADGGFAPGVEDDHYFQFFAIMFF